MLIKYKFSPTVWSIIFGLLLLRIGTTMSQPFLAIFLHFKAGISLSLTGIIVGSSYLSYVIGGFFGGILSDRYGKRNLLSLSLVLYAMTFFAFGMAASLISRPILLAVIFLIINLIGGLFRIWSETIGQAMISDLTIPEQKVSVFSMRYTAINIGGAIGPILGTMIGFAGNMLGFYFTGVMCFLYFILFTYISRRLSISNLTYSENITISLAAKTILHDKALLYFILGGVFTWLVYIQSSTTLGQIMEQRFHDSHLFGFILALNCMFVVCLQIPITSFCMQGKRSFPAFLMKLGCILTSIGLLGFAFSGQRTLFYIVSQLIFTIGEIFILPTMSIIIDEIAPVKLRGIYFGSTGFQSLGMAIGPVLGGLLLQYSNGIVVLSIFAVIALMTTYFYHQGGKRI
jgi:MFS family permease